MNIIRSCFDNFYDCIKPLVFSLTKYDLEKAHELFVKFSQVVYSTGLEKFILDNKTNQIDNNFEISNAAGFNKNADIPPIFLKYLGLDRVVIGTVTGDYWKGNERPRMTRYPATESLVNWMGLPGIGAEKISEKLLDYGDHQIPITINLMATPNKKGDGTLKDLKKV